ncbi:fibronectin type III domain-containing protein [Amycolatopsis rifamycinica]|uniref:fibronectin type III domain-containing protein n=1 Tax=Amycolatopsis rifamycinica TaxID=287986 RepID=UPI001269D490|nr:fibronectin type III domain-containing protein [Amycolatopsis rifamycinica]
MIRGGKGAAWRARAPIAVAVAGCLAVVGLAVGGAADPLGGFAFSPSGHWVYNPQLGAAFHVNGGGDRADAQVDVPGAGAGPVVQGDTSGFVIGPSKIVEFGKSSLTVENTTAAPSDERPVTLEVRGGPYAVYRQAGTIARLGELGLIPAGGPIGDVVATGDGKLWLQRADAGLLCELPEQADRLSCPVALPQGHRGRLTVVADRPVFVDTTDDTMRPVEPTELGSPAPLELDVPDTAQLASTDVAGQLAILDAPGQKLHLVDTAGLTKDRPPARPRTVSLPPGDYTGIESSGGVVAVVNRTTHTLHTFDSAGVPRAQRPIPGGDSQPPLVKGGDARVYVDGADGAHVMVVDHDGGVSEVPVTGDRKPDSDQQPPQPQQPPPPAASTPAQPPAAAEDRRPVAPPKKTQPPRQQQQPPPTKAALPASPPGAPRSVAATADEGAATVSWGAAAPNGAPVTSYRISWAGGGKTVDGTARSTRISGLANGTAYVFTVVAVNRAGEGPGVSSKAVTPRAAVSPPGRPGSLAVEATTKHTWAKVTWTAAAPNGAPVTAYHVSWVRDDGSRSGSKTLSGSARTYTIEDIWDGKDIPFTVTVTAENSAGKGPSASAHKAPPS